MSSLRRRRGAAVAAERQREAATVTGEREEPPPAVERVRERERVVGWGGRMGEGRGVAASG